MPKYQKPNFFTKNIFNPFLMLLTRVGLSLRGSRTLAVRGRKSGEWRTVPVNPLTIGDARYLVAPRGTTEWVRNLRVARTGELRLGSKVESFRAEEVSDAEKPEILRNYLKHWKTETGIFFGGVSDTSPDEDLRRIAPEHPVFRITPS